jgi:tRNA-specific adenosine deaminase 2
VFVYNGTIIGRGMNDTNRSYNGTRHAEFIAINQLLSTTTPSGEQKYPPNVLKECDLYVTVEPCIMCASLLRQFGIRKVYFGAVNDKFGGTGGVLNVHRRNGRAEVEDESEELKSYWGKDDYEVSGGWLREEAIVLLRRFYVQENERGEYPPCAKGR